MRVVPSPTAKNPKEFDPQMSQRFRDEVLESLDLARSIEREDEIAEELGPPKTRNERVLYAFRCYRRLTEVAGIDETIAIETAIRLFLLSGNEDARRMFDEGIKRYGRITASGGDMHVWRITVH
jgi:hypothetical protein